MTSDVFQRIAVYFWGMAAALGLTAFGYVVWDVAGGVAAFTVVALIMFLVTVGMEADD